MKVVKDTGVDLVPVVYRHPSTQVVANSSLIRKYTG